VEKIHVGEVNVYSDVFRNLKGGTRDIFQMYIFKGLQNLARFFILNISTIFFTSKGQAQRLSLEIRP